MKRNAYPVVLALLALCVLATPGCLVRGSKAKQEYSERQSMSRFQRSWHDFANYFAGYPDGLERSFSRWKSGMSRDYQTTRDRLAGLPNTVSENWNEGVAATRSDLQGIVRGVQKDIERFPYNAYRFWRLS